MAVSRTKPQLLSVFHPMSTNGDHRLLTEEGTKRGDDFMGRRVGRGSYFPLFLVFIQGTLTTVRVALLCRLLYFHACRLSLLARLTSRLATSSGKVTPPRGIACIPKILHKNTHVLRKQKLAQSDENEHEQTHPGADDPSS
jgi:hypothetical protein